MNTAHTLHTHRGGIEKADPLGSFAEAPSSGLGALGKLELLLLMRMADDPALVLESAPMMQKQAARVRDRFYVARQKARSNKAFHGAQMENILERGASLVPLPDGAWRVVIGPRGMSGKTIYAHYARLYSLNAQPCAA